MREGCEETKERKNLATSCEKVTQLSPRESMKLKEHVVRITDCGQRRKCAGVTSGARGVENLHLMC